MASALRSLLDLHPSLWTGKHYAHAAGSCLSSGFDALDAELPGGGWPIGSLIELQAPQDSSALSLLLPALNTLPAERLRILVAPPYQPMQQRWRGASATTGQSATSENALAARLIWIRSQHLNDTLWASAQALRHGHCAAVLSWLPAHVPFASLRQLQLLANQSDSLFFCLRPAHSQANSPALLRLDLQTRQDQQGQPWLDVHIRKRRGPPCKDSIALAPHHILMPPTAIPSHVPMPATAPESAYA
ncbi:translesion DNA synthesis-associated protein ImuA [Alcaligenes aquatilis]|uniref:translesion DNA synthesis-associated protein ImuA n=1 Tax=Alcaligenes aquatilis TaxID=323284 RepID=UPI003F92297E